MRSLPEPRRLRGSLRKPIAAIVMFGGGSPSARVARAQPLPRRRLARILHTRGRRQREVDGPSFGSRALTHLGLEGPWGAREKRHMGDDRALLSRQS
jgi:hypothetical protein